MLFEVYLYVSEGEFLWLCVQLVNGLVLVVIVCELELGDCLKFGFGEFKSGGFWCELIFVDVFEVLIVVVYFDGGFEVC